MFLNGSSLPEVMHVLWKLKSSGIAQTVIDLRSDGKELENFLESCTDDSWLTEHKTAKIKMAYSRRVL